MTGTLGSDSEVQTLTQLPRFILRRTIEIAFNVIISSRTPEGLPHKCPVCGKMSRLEPSLPGGDSCCPNCGHLLFWLRDRIAGQSGVATDQVRLSSSLDRLGVDSLAFVELVMDIEEHFQIAIPDADYERLRTVADVIRYIDNSGLIEPA